MSIDGFQATTLLTEVCACSYYSLNTKRAIFAMDLRQYIRDIQDFPVEGILFRDITP